MCDEQDLERFAREQKTGGISRRGFSVLGAAGAVAACTTSQKAGAAVDSLEESDVSFATEDGTMDGYFVHPSEGKHPAVLFWPDIGGLREAKRAMARRLAGEGYAVFVANPYYRDVKGEQFKDFADFMQNDGFQKVKPWRDKFTPEAIMRDGKAAVGWLLGQEAVDSQAGVGSQGYCMTGSFAIFTAAAAPDHVRGIGSFHGGGLVRPGPMSPHEMLEDKAKYLICIARNDDAKAPDDKVELRKAAAAAGVDAEIEVYDANHGWCVLDSPSYDKAEAERAWARLLDLYGRTLPAG